MCLKEKLKEKNIQIISINKATKSLNKEKAVFVITDLNDMVNIKGYIAYISKSTETRDKMVEYAREMSNSGKQTMLIGSYENGGAIGVQYEF